MSVVDVAAPYIGHPVEVEDSSAPDQCMDWAFRYVDLIGVPGGHATIRAAAAKDVMATFDRNQYDVISTPVSGCLVIWGTAVGQWGNIAVFKSGSIGAFISYDQNWAGQQYVREVSHNGYGIIGFLMPKVLQSGSMEPTVPFSYADFLNGYATDGVALRVIGRRFNAPEMTLFKTLPMGERFVRLRSWQERRDRVNEYCLDLMGRYATDAEQVAWLEWDLPMLYTAIRNSAESQTFRASKGGAVDVSGVQRAARNGAFDEVIGFATTKKQ